MIKKTSYFTNIYTHQILVPTTIYSLFQKFSKNISKM